MKAIFVHDTVKEPYAYWIVSGRKGIETRSKDMLRDCVGERVAIVRTMSGKPPMVIGYVFVFGSAFCGDKAMFEFWRDETLIPIGSKYDYHGSSKWFYGLCSAEICEPYPLPKDAVRHGRSWCEF